jgi:hypothetical protein
MIAQGKTRIYVVDFNGKQQPIWGGAKVEILHIAKDHILIRYFDKKFRMKLEDFDNLKDASVSWGDLIN